MHGKQKEQFLLHRIRVYRDERAFKTLHDAYVESLSKFLRAKLPSQQDADDALSATFLRVWSYATTSHVDHAAGVIFAIARAVVADYYRTRKQTVSLDDQEPIDVLDAQGEHKILHNADTSLLHRFMLRLEEDYQTVLSLRYFQDLSIREISKRMDRSEPAVRMLLHRALKALRVAIDPNHSHDNEGT